MQAVYVFWLRQVKRYVRSKARIIGSLGQPLLFLIALGYGLGPVFKSSGQGNYIQFLVPGIIGLTLLFSSMFTGIEIIWDRRFGFLKETLVAPVSRFSIMLGKAFGGATIATLQGLLLFAISFALGFRMPADRIIFIIPALIVMFLIALLFTAFGIAVATQLEDTESFPLIVNFVMFPIFFLSGALFPLEGIPQGLAVVTKLNPLSYGVDALRSMLIAQSHFPFAFDMGIIIVLSLIILAIGSALFSRITV